MALPPKFILDETEIPVKIKAMGRADAARKTRFARKEAGLALPVDSGQAQGRKEEVH
jgi:hypothetical protein